MPYLGEYNGEIVSPSDVSADVTVTCIDCNGTMSVRKAHQNDGHRIPRHFFHKSGGGDGCGGESEVHQIMKVLAHDRLTELYDDYGTVEYEKHIGNRFADVCVTFDQPHIPYGKGIVVEAQYKHKDKNTGGAQYEFFEHGYSVYWMYLSDVNRTTDDEISIEDNAEFDPRRLRCLWPEMVPDVSEWSGYSPHSPHHHGQTNDEYAMPQTGATSNECRIPIKVPLDYLEANVFDLVNTRQLTSEQFPFIGRAALHGKGRYQAWFEFYNTPYNVHLLEFHTADKKEETSDCVFFLLQLDELQKLEQFISSVKQYCEANDPSSGADDGSWTPVTTVEFVSTTFGTGWLTFAQSHDSHVLRVGRDGPNGNTRTATVTYRWGDEDRLEDHLYALLKQYKEEWYTDLPVYLP